MISLTAAKNVRAACRCLILAAASARPALLGRALHSGKRIFPRFPIERGLLREFINFSTLRNSWGTEEIEKPAASDKPTQDLNDIGLHPQLLADLKAAGIDSLYPVQSQCYDSIRKGKDIICKSKTGSGKTLAFAIPIVQAIREKNHNLSSRKSPFAVVITPTRELANQVFREFERIAPDLRSVAVYGGVSLLPQISTLRNGVDILVGTPGRLIDHLENENVNLGATSFAVLDEADQMLQMGFQEDVERIFSFLPASENRQTMLWSATVPGWVHNISNKYLSQSVFIDLVGEEDSKIPTTISHLSIAVSSKNREQILAQLCAVYGKNKRTLVFTKTKVEVDSLALSSPLKSLHAESMHGGMTQAGREYALQRFKSGETKIIIATDVAARGLDIPDVEIVIHYRLPIDWEAFVHRTGRTGRAGKSGTNIVLVEPGEEESNLISIQNKYAFKAARVAVPAEEDSKLDRQLYRKIVDMPKFKSGQFKTMAQKLISNSNLDAETLLGSCLAIIKDEDYNCSTYSMLSGERDMQTVMAHSPMGVDERDLRNLLKELSPDVAIPRDFRKTASHGGGLLFDVSPRVAEKLMKASEERSEESEERSEDSEEFGSRSRTLTNGEVKRITFTIPSRLDDGVETKYVPVTRSPYRSSDRRLNYERRYGHEHSSVRPQRRNTRNMW